MSRSFFSYFFQALGVGLTGGLILNVNQPKGILIAFFVGAIVSSLLGLVLAASREGER